MRKRLTEEERKANKRASDKRYREANKERISKSFKEYYKANKERMNLQSKAYREDNKDKVREYDIKYKKANKQYHKEYKRAYHESKRLKDIHIVYCLPNTDIPYAGVTKRPDLRMQQHRSLTKRDTSDWFVLKVCKTREEAFEVEREYHEKGYDGANEHHYKQVS